MAGSHDALHAEAISGVLHARSILQSILQEGAAKGAELQETDEGSDYDEDVATHIKKSQLAALGTSPLTSAFFFFFVWNCCHLKVWECVSFQTQPDFA